MEKRCLGCMKEYDKEVSICPYCSYIEGTPAKEAYHISPGEVLINRYQIGRVLGSGGFGITYIGYDNLLEQVVAIKEYLPTEFATRMPKQSQVTIYGGEPEEQFKAGLKKTLDETQRLAQFQNEPDIIHVYDFFEENNTAYIVMEYLDGETLKDRLKKVEKMTIEEALPIILSVLSALRKVHAVGIVHRDIAPDNIYLLKDGSVKLIDFGASRQATTAHTKSLTVIVKFGYAPLEQYQSGGNQGPWTDIYALAATFYKMITGIRPNESTERRLDDQLKEPSKLGVVINKNTENALMNALNVKIDDRIKSALEFEEALLASEVLRVDATPDKAANVKWPLWLKFLAGGAAAFVLIFVVALAVGVVGNYKIGTSGKSVLAEGETRIPNLVNMEQNEARKIVEENGLEFQVGDSETSDKIKEGRILGQKVSGEKVKAGSTVKKGTVLSVTISSGKGTVDIPDVLWMKKELATEVLKNNRLIVINYMDDAETFAAPGTVTGIEPSAGSNVELKQNIILKIASERKQVLDTKLSANIPELKGQAVEKAYEMLKMEGLYLEKTEMQYSDMVEKGNVISQLPSVGDTKSHKGDTVSIIVSAGKERIEIPYLQNETKENAISLLSGFGLIPDEQHLYDDGVQSGHVVRQDMEAGSYVDKGTVVTFYVSDGPKPTGSQEVKTSTASPQKNKTDTGVVNQTAAAPSTTAPPSTTAAAPPTTAAPPPTTAPKTEADPIWDVVGN